MGTIRFTLRIDKPNKEGLSPIELIYQLSGKRKYFRTKERLRSENWNDKDQKVIYLDRRAAKKLLPTIDYDLLPSSKQVDEFNDKLGSIKKEIADIEKRFELNRIVYSVEMVIDALKDNRSPTTKTEAPSNQVFDFIDKYIEDYKASREPGSMSVYKSLKNHLKNFEIKRKEKVTFEKIDKNFFTDFQNYLIVTPSRGAPEGLGNVTIAKTLSTLKTFLGYAREQGFEVSDKYKTFKIKKEKLEVIALTDSEFLALYNLDLSDNKALGQVRDVFIFSCCTGLRYSDLAQLKREHINIKEEEIKLTVTKTKRELFIPLTPYANAILEKYSALLRPLPIISNQKMNDHLKNLCERAKINSPVQIVRFRGNRREENTYPKFELISVHTGRKTFATLSLEKGMSAEEVMEIGGWETYASFQRYVKVTEKRAKVVMRKAWGEIPMNKLKAV